MSSIKNKFIWKNGQSGQQASKEYRKTNFGGPAKLTGSNVKQLAYGLP